MPTFNDAAARGAFDELDEFDDLDEDELDDSLAQENEQRVRIFEAAAEWLTQCGHPSEVDYAYVPRSAPSHSTLALISGTTHAAVAWAVIIAAKRIAGLEPENGALITIIPQDRDDLAFRSIFY